MIRSLQGRRGKEIWDVHAERESSRALVDLKILLSCKDMLPFID